MKIAAVIDTSGSITHEMHEINRGILSNLASDGHEIYVVTASDHVTHHGSFTKLPGCRYPIDRGGSFAWQEAVDWANKSGDFQMILTFTDGLR